MVLLQIQEVVPYELVVLVVRTGQLPQLVGRSPLEDPQRLQQFPDDDAPTWDSFTLETLGNVFLNALRTRQAGPDAAQQRRQVITRLPGHHSCARRFPYSQPGPHHVLLREIETGRAQRAGHGLE